MNQELILQASLLERESREIQGNLELIDREIIELEQLNLSLGSLSETRHKEMLSSIGKGLYVKGEMTEKDLFVEVGSGVVVKKSPKETIAVIEKQIKALREARAHLLAQLDTQNRRLTDIISEIEKEQSRAKTK